MDIDELTKLITEKRSQLGQRIADVPNIEGKYREDLYGNARQLSSMYENENAIS